MTMSPRQKKNVSITHICLGRHCLKNSTVDWAELITLDLSLYEQPGGKEELVKQLDHAVRHVGKYKATWM